MMGPRTAPDGRAILLAVVGVLLLASMAPGSATSERRAARPGAVHEPRSDSLFNQPLPTTAVALCTQSITIPPGDIVGFTILGIAPQGPASTEVLVPFTPSSSAPSDFTLVSTGLAPDTPVSITAAASPESLIEACSVISSALVPCRVTVEGTAATFTMPPVGGGLLLVTLTTTVSLPTPTAP